MWWCNRCWEKGACAGAVGTERNGCAGVVGAGRRRCDGALTAKRRKFCQYSGC